MQYRNNVHLMLLTKLKISPTHVWAERDYKRTAAALVSRPRRTAPTRHRTACSSLLLRARWCRICGDRSQDAGWQGSGCSSHSLSPLVTGPQSDKTPHTRIFSCPNPPPPHGGPPHATENTAHGTRWRQLVLAAAAAENIVSNPNPITEQRDSKIGIVAHIKYFIIRFLS